MRAGWESIISLATAWLDPFSEGLSTASHQLLLRPVLLHILAGLGCGMGFSHGTGFPPGSPGTAMLLRATYGGDEPVFCSVIIIKLKQKPRRGNLISIDLMFCQEGAVLWEDVFRAICVSGGTETQPHHNSQCPAPRPALQQYSGCVCRSWAGGCRWLLCLRKG